MKSGCRETRKQALLDIFTLMKKPILSNYDPIFWDALGSDKKKCLSVKMLTVSGWAIVE